MKRILASLFVTSVAIFSAAAANADATATSIHEGNIQVSCDTLVPTDGLLTKRSDTEISSAGGDGNFNVKCNSNHTLKFQILNNMSSQPSIPVDAAYTRKFSLSTTDPRYTVVTTSGFIVNPASQLSFAGLLPTTSSGYNVKVAAQGTVSSSHVLPGSTTPYKIVIEAMLVSN